MKSMHCLFLVATLLLPAGCNGDAQSQPPEQQQPPATASASATTTPTGVSDPRPATAPAGDEHSIAAQLAGHWRGDAKVIVNWVAPQRLAVVLDIAPDGRVSGTVGDARLVDAGFVANPLGRKLRIHGKLEGNLIDAERVRRGGVDILVAPAGDGTLTGGLHSTGTEIGGKGSMKLSASDMVLRREPAMPAGVAK